MSAGRFWDSKVLPRGGRKRRGGYSGSKTTEDYSMKQINFDAGWEFTLNGRTETVDLPHDYSMEQPRTPESRTGMGGGYFQCGDGVYRKKICGSPVGAGGVCFLEIEGAYMNAEVFADGEKIGFHPYGYTTFRCDLTPYLKADVETELEVRTSNNALPNSRWYSGSGLYRHMRLLTAEDRDCFLRPWGVFVRTEAADETRAVLHVETEAVGEDALLRSTVVDSDGRTAALAETRVFGGKAVQTIEIPNPHFWSCESPALYTLKTELCSGSSRDESGQVFGVRTVALSEEKGLLLNGCPVKLRGGCIHHDCGILGAASFDAAEERKVRGMKQAGFNAIRCAHNPPAPAFLDACDRLGMLVIDEAFDCWNVGKTPYDYHLYFDKWWKDDLLSMVLRDRNHPSVIFWSTGNEIPERNGLSDGAAVSRRLANAVRACDSSRPVTNALCGLWGKDTERGDWGDITEPFAAPLDAVGCNYLWKRYEDDLKKFPHRFIIGTETVPAEAFENEAAAQKSPRVLGDFVWTSIDYLGEAGIGQAYFPEDEAVALQSRYPWHISNCGDLDLCCRPRPQSCYRQILWGTRKKPYLVVHAPNAQGKKKKISYWGWDDVSASWSFPGCEGFPMFVDVYFKGGEVELFLNGKSLGRKKSGEKERYIASFETVYVPGVLKAIAYADGRPCGEETLVTCGEPAQLLLTAESAAVKADIGSVVYAEAVIADRNGNLVPYADEKIVFSVKGPGRIAAAGSCNPLSEESYGVCGQKAFRGSCTAVVRSDGTAGKIVLTAVAEGVGSACVSICAE
jgi:beta-galactosidase